MLSIGGMGSGQGSYYIDLAKEDYYLEGGEPLGQWIGTGAADKGITGTVNKEAFHALFQGYSPDGLVKFVQSAGSETHRPGWDLTFSAPKSLSVLWSQVDADTRQVLQRAHFEAVKKAIGYLEDEATVCRTGKGGHTPVPAKLVVATFEHGTSRALDANLHTHALVLNMGVCADGKLRTLESKPLFEHKMTAGALYRAELSYQLQETLQVQVERERAWFEVQGVSRPLMEAMSTRRKEIEAVLHAKGYTSAEASAVAALETREVKGHVAREELFHHKWQEMGKAAGWSREEAQALLHRFRQEPVERDPEIEALAAVHRATQKLMQQNSHFGERDLMRMAAEEAQPYPVGIDRLRATVGQQLRQGQQFVRLGEERGQVRYTTREMLDLESKMLDTVEMSRQKGSHKVPARVIESAIHAVETEKGRPLSQEQKDALLHITARAGSIQVVSGMAGTGKTDMLYAACMAWKAEGYTVRGAALAGRAAEGLAKDARIEATTIAAMLLRMERGTLELNAHTILIVDEAGMVDTRQMKRVVDAVDAAGAKLVLVGDARQLQPIAAGGPFKAIGERLGAAHLQEIKRQAEPWMRQAVTDIAGGEAQTALYAYARAGRLNISEDRDQARMALIASWKEAGIPHPRQNLIIANTTLETTILNRMAQRECLDAGQLGKKTVPINGETLHEGDRILFTKNSNIYNVKNGFLATVESIGETRHTLTARLDTDGRLVTVPLGRYQDIQLGYAITTHKGQGVTVDRVYALVGDEMQNLHQSYVQLSRSRHETRLFTTTDAAGENLTTLARDMSALRQKELAHDVIQRLEKQQVQEQETIRPTF